MAWVSFDTIIKGTPAQVNLLEGWGLGNGIKSGTFIELAILQVSRCFALQ